MHRRNPACCPGSQASPWRAIDTLSIEFPNRAALELCRLAARRRWHCNHHQSRSIDGQFLNVAVRLRRLRVAEPSLGCVTSSRIGRRNEPYRRSGTCGRSVSVKFPKSSLTRRLQPKAQRISCDLSSSYSLVCSLPSVDPGICAFNFALLQGLLRLPRLSRARTPAAAAS